MTAAQSGGNDTNELCLLMKANTIDNIHLYDEHTIMPLCYCVNNLYRQDDTHLYDKHMITYCVTVLTTCTISL